MWLFNFVLCCDLIDFSSIWEALGFPKIYKNRSKRQKVDFGACLGRIFFQRWVWGGFWGSFEKGLEGLGVSWATFLRLFLVLVFGMLSNRGPKGSWAGFWFHFQGFGRGPGRILGRFWEGFGRVLGGFGGSKIAVFLDCVFWFRVLVVGAFGGVWVENNMPQDSMRCMI